KARYPDMKMDKHGVPAEHQEEPLCWECKVGMCGLCVVQVLDGADNLVPPDKGSPEMNTLEVKAAVDPDPKQYRLACVAKIKGPVKRSIRVGARPPPQNSHHFTPSRLEGHEGPYDAKQISSSGSEGRAFLVPLRAHRDSVARRRARRSVFRVVRQVGKHE